MFACHCIVGSFFHFTEKRSRKKALQSSPCYWLSFFSCLFFYSVFDPLRLLNSGRRFVWIFPDVINLLYLLLLLFFPRFAALFARFLLNVKSIFCESMRVGGKPLCAKQWFTVFIFFACQIEDNRW